MIAHGWSDFSVNYQSKYLALQWSKQNAVIFLDAKKKENKDIQIQSNLRIVEWPGIRPVGFKDFVFAMKIMRSFKPDLIITNFAANDIMLFISAMLGVKQRVCYFHTMVQQHLEDFGSLSLRQRINIFRKGFAFRKATHLIAPSHAAKKDLVQYYKVDPSKVFVFQNAIADTEIRNQGKNKIIGFLGRLDKSKGVDILLHAFCRIQKFYPDTQLFIAGSGRVENELKNIANELNIVQVVFFNGTIAAENVRSFLASLHFLVVPSRMDNLPTVALEALSVGTPVIASNTGGLQDIVEDGYNGYLFDKENVDMLAKKMAWLIEHEDKRNEMSVHARVSFEKKYSINNLLERFEILLNNKNT